MFHMETICPIDQSSCRSDYPQAAPLEIVGLLPDLSPEAGDVGRMSWSIFSRQIFLIRERGRIFPDNSPDCLSHVRCDAASGALY